MRRVLPATVLALIIGAFGSTGAPASAKHSGYSITGSARSAYPTPAGPGFSVLHVSARSGLAGQHPHGYVSVEGDVGAPMGAFTGGGAVTCLRVSQNKVAIKYRFAYATGSAATFAGGGVEIFIEDNGRPHGGKAVDATTFDPPQPAGVFDATADQCDDPNVAAYNTVESGDYALARHKAKARHRRHHRHHRHHRKAHKRHHRA